ncbi:hypothetical protein COLO4_01884, partial [Corchorus olitorius]
RRLAPRRFLHEQPDEGHVIDEVTPEHAARLLQEAVEPFQPGLLHPDRRAFHVADRHVERAAHAHRERDLHFGLVAAEELFLLWRADRHEQQVGPRVADLRHHLRFFVLALPVAVAVAGQYQVRVLALVGAGDLADDLFLRAEQEHAPALLAGAAHQRLEQVDAGHALLERLAQQARGPHDRHAVDVDERAVVDNLAQFGIAAGLDQLVDVDDDVLVRAAALDEALDGLQRLFHRQ